MYLNELIITIGAPIWSVLKNSEVQEDRTIEGTAAKRVSVELDSVNANELE